MLKSKKAQQLEKKNENLGHAESFCYLASSISQDPKALYEDLDTFIEPDLSQCKESVVEEADLIDDWVDQRILRNVNYRDVRK